MKNPGDERRRRLERAGRADPHLRAHALAERQRTGEIPLFPVDLLGREWFEVQPYHDHDRWPWSYSFGNAARGHPFQACVLARWLEAGVELVVIQRSGWPFHRPEADYGATFSEARTAQHPLVALHYTVPAWMVRDMNDPDILAWLERLRSSGGMPVPGSIFTFQSRHDVAARFYQLDAFQRAYCLWAYWWPDRFGPRAVPILDKPRVTTTVVSGWSRHVLPVAPRSVVWAPRSPLAASGVGLVATTDPHLGWFRWDYFMAAMAIRNGVLSPEGVALTDFPWKASGLDSKKFVESLGFIWPLHFDGHEIEEQGDTPPRTPLRMTEYELTRIFSPNRPITRQEAMDVFAVLRDNGWNITYGTFAAGYRSYRTLLQDRDVWWFDADVQDALLTIRRP